MSNADNEAAVLVAVVGALGVAVALLIHLITKIP